MHEYKGMHEYKTMRVPQRSLVANFAHYVLFNGPEFSDLIFGTQENESFPCITQSPDQHLRSVQ